MDGHVLEPSTSGRARCRACGATIAKGELRLGERVPNPFAEDGGETTQWYHPRCGALRRPEVYLAATERAEAAAPADLVAAARAGVAHHRLPRIDGLERAPTGRARCRSCRETISKGAWRIRLVIFDDSRFQPMGFVHASCAREYFGTDALDDHLRAFGPELPEEERAVAQREIRADSA